MLDNPPCHRQSCEKIDTLVLPGLNGSGDGHWQAFWLDDHSDAKKIEQDDWTCPDLAHWSSRLEAELENHSGVWLVAHSLGSVLAANLATSPLANRVRGALLVAPCDLAHVERLHPYVVNFGSMPAQRLPFPSMVIASRNDPYMEFETTRHYARLWGGELADVGAQGHINIKSGHGRWPLGYDFLDHLKSRVEGVRSASRHHPSLLPKAFDFAAPVKFTRDV
ncbi:alpha/beta hydrolase [Rhizobium sp.]|jgi:uncharacterized protein|uniref:alpha/beta hydrolase n=1 Tax=Rhizobium sp. TaxID=391 RepID=UPI000E7D289E|nr:hypothetical protein [Rhizobium sp.]